MSTLDRIAETRQQLSPADCTHEQIIVAFLLDKFRELPREAVSDLTSLGAALMSQEANDEDRYEIVETIREILFPEVIGGIQMGSAGSVKPTQKLQKRKEHISGVIKAKRKEKGLTQVQLAKKSGLPQSHISRLERAAHSPSFKTLEKVAKALGVSVGDIDPAH